MLLFKAPLYTVMCEQIVFKKIEPADSNKPISWYTPHCSGAQTALGIDCIVLALAYYIIWILVMEHALLIEKKHNMPVLVGTGDHK